MNCQSVGRIQRSRGFNIKLGFQLALLLAVCIWLLYQIKHSQSEGKGYGKSVKVKLNEEHGAVVLGRKGDAGWLSDTSSSESEDGDFVGEGKKEEDGGAGDDDLDGKAEEESFRNENGDVGRSFASNGKKEIQNETEIQTKVSPNTTDNTSGTEVQEKDKEVKLIEDLPREDYTGKGHDYLKGSMSDHDDQGDASDLKTQTEHDEKEGETDQNGMENVTVSDQQAVLDGDHGFHDENGIPQDRDNHLISMLSGRRDDQANIRPQETMLSSNNRSTTTGNALAEEVAVEEETDGANITTSSIIHLSEATPGDSLVSEDSHSVPSHHEQQEVNISLPRRRS